MWYAKKESGRRLQDEVRHVAFGRLVLRDFYPQLSEAALATGSLRTTASPGSSKVRSS